MKNDEWFLHEQALLEFEQAWNSGEPPDVVAFLEILFNDPGTNRLNRDYASLELAKIDLERQLKTGDATRRCEFYLDAIPRLCRNDEALRALLAIEIATREAQGEAVSDDELRERFPDQSPALQTLIPLSHRAKLTGAHRPSSSDMVGPYQLLYQIGEGGMGAVWLAEQLEPVRRRVALKLVKSGMADKQVVARFEAERQALALMDHPNIAKVLDAGATADGAPYFVMELVEGDPITEYCDANKLTPRERLQLFVPVCRAVQHAHQKGIIHRDLKPSNVLVTDYDGQPLVKVIDFGLAKALQHHQKLTDKTMFTEFGQVLGTLTYMSPEQARLDALDVDTRSDIYSLGVILYELLAGSTPLDRETVRNQAFLAILELVREREPPRPSHRLSTSADRLRTVSAQRQIEPGRLQQMLRGDLDWIIMKALEKDRTRRYDSAAGFADDVSRFLSGSTVEARPPTLGYRLRKFTRKHRLLVSMTALTAVLLSAGIAGTTIFAMRANEARRRANVSQSSAQRSAKRSADVLKVVTDAFRSVDPSLGADADMSALDVLREARTSLDGSDLDNEGRLMLIAHLASAFLTLGEFEDAVSTGRDWLRLSESFAGGASHRLSAMNNLAVAYHGSGRLSEAISFAKEVLEARRAELGDQHEDTLRSMNNLAALYDEEGKFDEALSLYELAFQGRKQTLGETHQATLASMGNLAVCYFQSGRMKEGAEMLESAFALRRETLGVAHPDTLNAMNNLAFMYQKTDRLDEAIAVLESVVSLRESKIGLTHLDTLTSKNNLAGAYKAAGRLDDALELGEVVLQGQRANLGDEHPATLNVLSNLATLYEQLGRLEDAEAARAECLEGWKRVRPDSWRRYYEAAQYGGLLLQLDRVDEAAPFLISGFEGLERLTQSIPAPRRNRRLRYAIKQLVRLAELRGDKEGEARWRARLEALGPPTSETPDSANDDVRWLRVPRHSAWAARVDVSYAAGAS